MFRAEKEFPEELGSMLGVLDPARLHPGGLVVAVTERGVRRIWLRARALPAAEARFLAPAAVHRGPGGPTSMILRRTLEELDAFFLGGLRTFTVPLDLEGQGSPYESRVWDALRRIPYGETRSYGEIARAAGRPGAARAVGRACGRNPIPVIVPCHRVVGADGSLTGFTGGLRLKESLLEIEGWSPAAPHANAGRRRADTAHKERMLP
jgi:methylated-DNA-[protein]-cysteine S-methyltransferase